MGIDRRLAVLGSDHDQGPVVKTFCLQLADECPNRGVDEFEFVQQRLGGRASGIQISARHVVAFLNELLPDANSLEVHAEDSGNLGLLGAKVVFPIDLVEYRVDLQGVVALNVLEAVGPGSQVRAWIEDCGAGYASGRRNAAKPDYIVVAFRPAAALVG